MPACVQPRVDFDALRSGSSHRHQCEVLRRVCVWNGTLTPLAPGADAEHAARVAKAMVVRSQFGSHSSFPLAQLHSLEPARAGSVAETLLARAARERGISPCVPLVWVPTWAFSFADSFVSSLVPLDELQSAGLIDEHVLLRPDLWAWPRSKNPIYRMIATLSAAPTLSLRESAPKCDERTAAQAAQAAAPLRQCAPTCYDRLLMCNFKSTFDAYGPPMAPWRAAQRVAASALAGRPVGAAEAVAAGEAAAAGAAGAAAAGSSGSGAVESEAATPSPSAVAFAAANGLPPPGRPRRRPRGVGPGGVRGDALRVLFVNRTRTKFSRSLTNIDGLMRRCGSMRGWHANRQVVCAVHEFGAGSLAADVRAARGADVLVGTHGAGLANAFFMRRGSALLEVRPYRFEGAWPDNYFRSLTGIEQAIHYYQVSSGSPDLSSPRPADDVSVWDARDHAVRLPWRTLREVLQVVLAVNRSHERYLQRVWTRGAVFVSQAGET